jgi:signal transduction histidine kinase
MTTKPASQAKAGVNGSFAGADRQLGRSVMAVFALAGVVAVLGPLLSYRSDLAQLRDLFRLRVVNASDSDGHTLERHLRLLQSELERLAGRSEVDLQDASMLPEQELLDSAHRNSTLFDTGVAIVDANGRLVWNMPGTLDAEGIARGDWFRRVAEHLKPTMDIADPVGQTFLVAVPVIRGGRFTGALVGFSKAVRSALSPASASDALVRIIRDQRGELSFPERRPWWSAGTDFLNRLKALPGEEGAFQLVAGEDLFAAVTPVGESGLALIEVGNEEQITNPVRYRFRLQMLLLTSLQTGAVLLLSLFLRRTYASFVAVERRALEQDRLLALGAASSLIAHEVKNSLNGLQAAASLLSAASGGTPADAALPVKSIRGEVDRLKHLASSLLLFGRPAEVRKQVTSLPDLVREVVEGLRVMPEAEEVEITLELPETLEVFSDPLLLATAVHNLARNAVEAAVSAKDLGRVRQPRVTVRVGRIEDEAVIEVDDNAGGVAPEVAARLFEPFVTGKPKGIGLGLSMTRRAMETQGGAVSWEPLPGGTRFMLRLPAPLPSAERPRMVS